MFYIQIRYYTKVIDLFGIQIHDKMLNLEFSCPRAKTLLVSKNPSKMKTMSMFVFEGKSRVQDCLRNWIVIYRHFETHSYVINMLLILLLLRSLRFSIHFHKTMFCFKSTTQTANAIKVNAKAIHSLSSYTFLKCSSR